MQKLFIILFLCVSSMLIAQTQEDVIYLKSGKVVRGIIVEQSSESVTIKLMGKYSFVYSRNEIEKITKEAAQPGTNYNTTTGKSTTTSNASGNVGELNAENKSTGYIGQIEVGINTTPSDYSLSQFKLNVINGYKFNPNFSAGLGVGLRYVLDSNEALNWLEPATYNIMPVFLNLRAAFGTGNVAPIASFNFGYSFNATGGFKGVGLMVNPSVGLAFGGKTKATLTVGYDFQKAPILFYDGGFDYIYTEENIGGLSLNLGITF